MKVGIARFHSASGSSVTIHSVVYGENPDSQPEISLSYQIRARVRRSIPHERDIDECEGTTYRGYTKCPDSVSSHPIRRSAITHHLDSDVPKAIVSERMNVSEKVLDHHYDARDKEQKRQNREEYLKSI